MESREQQVLRMLDERVPVNSRYKEYLKLAKLLVEEGARQHSLDGMSVSNKAFIKFLRVIAQQLSARGVTPQELGKLRLAPKIVEKAARHYYELLGMGLTPSTLKHSRNFSLERARETVAAAKKFFGMVGLERTVVHKVLLGGYNSVSHAKQNYLSMLRRAFTAFEGSPRQAQLAVAATHNAFGQSRRTLEQAIDFYRRQDQDRLARRVAAKVSDLSSFAQQVVDETKLEPLHSLSFFEAAPKLVSVAHHIGGRFGNALAGPDEVSQAAYLAGLEAMKQGVLERRKLVGLMLHGALKEASKFSWRRDKKLREHAFNEKGGHKGRVSRKPFKRE